ncbi:S-methyl-5'-thioinosine phosphorylase [Sulfuricella sp.]|uniref:S-methyl-5'-thioinosine phosphorylase n=1 Tax=Sulfuricella sp. TaxID=2099377 RepID=UPI002CF8D6AD|nr:S-methyl-5'-thioinosine phosphorylase [Sulfuricella sp.]HUX63623.1 S-methyl-5'-thioinosine phosphorylase [Sulfuricella sp.]
MLGIIGGTGLTQLANLEITHRQVIRTPYGEPSGALTFGKIKDHEVAFMARHGYGHSIPPHEVNYQANMWALQAQGVKNVVSIAAVGGINPDYEPGAIVIPDQIIDYTHGRKATFYEGNGKSVTHVDFTEPYCEKMRQQCMQAASLAGEKFIDGGVYAAVQGPRLETAAEINRLDRDGATMVGMTGMPEAVLARELGLCYAAIAVVANHAAGRNSSKHVISFEEIDAVLKQAMQRVRIILEHVVGLDGD